MDLLALLLVLAAVLLAAWVLSRVAEWVRLPPLVGMIVGGALVGALPLHPPGFDAVSGVLRLAVLVLVLLRAGLGISLDEMRAAGPLGLRLGILPLLGDALAVALGGYLLLGLAPWTALALGFLVGAISPAIVIPGVLELLAEAPKDQRRTEVALLTGAPLDNIVAVVALGVVLDVVAEGRASWSTLALDLPWRLGGGIGIGLLAGLAFVRFAPEEGRRAELDLWVLGGLLVWAGKAAGFSFVLAVLALGGTVRAWRETLVRPMSVALASHWRWAQIALFGLIGAAVDVPALAGVGLAAVGVILLGQAGRALGSLLATTASGMPPRQRLACIAAYVPKATIQAAFAGLALERGVPGGEVLLGTGVLAVVLTAPVGVLTLYRGTRSLLRAS